MLDVGWSELLVIAVVLIVVVGPKDLPPMLRAFGRMSRKFTAMAGDFRKQFDDALNEADMGDLRQTMSDVQKLNPVHSLREAMNPLRQAAEDLRSDIKKTVDAPAPAAVTLPETPVKLDAAPPVVPAAEPKTLVPEQPTIVSNTSVLAESLKVTPVEEVIQVKPKAKRKPKVGTTVAVDGQIATITSDPVVEVVKPRRKAAAAAKTEGAETVVAKPRKKTITKKDLA